MRLDLVCTPSLLLGLIGSSFFIGLCVSTMIVPPLADKIGRKWLWRGSLITTVGCMVGMIFCKNIYLMIGLMFIAGFCTSGRFLVNYVFGSEFLTEKWRVLFGTLVNAFDTSSVIYSAIYFDFVSTWVWPYECIGIGLAIISLILNFLFIPESPIWLLKTGRIDEGIVCIR